MEKTFKSVIESYCRHPHKKKLDYLDAVAYFLLLNKEIYLLENAKNNYVKQIENILSRYHDYRGIIYKKMSKTDEAGRKQLIRDIYLPPERLIFLLTHNCQLRCKYCKVRKFSSSMKEDVLFKGVDLLFSSHRQDFQLQFFGGEPLLRFDLLKKAVAYSEQINKKLKRDLRFILTTNGIALSREKIDFFKKHNFLIECSIDGEIENQLETRKACNGRNYYSQAINNFKNLFKSNIAHYSISVVMPENVHLMFSSFRHLVKIGFKKIQMNYALGIYWPEDKIKVLLEQTKEIFALIKRKKDIEFINLTLARREPVVLNAELTVDCDGGIYLESGICLEEDFLAMKKKFLLTNVRDSRNIGIYGSTPFQNFYRLTKAYSELRPNFRRVILNNIFVGTFYDEFLKSGCKRDFKSQNAFPFGFFPEKNLIF